MRNQIQLLIDGADTKVLSVPGILNTYRHAVELYFAAALLVRPTQDLHQSGFSGAVLAEQHVNFAPAQLKVNLIQSQNARKGLADLRHLQKRSSFHRHRSSFECNRAIKFLAGLELARPILGPAFDHNLLLGVELNRVATLAVQHSEKAVLPTAERKVGHRRRDSDVYADISCSYFITKLARRRAAGGED